MKEMIWISFNDKALKVGAIESHVIDVKDEFAEDYVLVALQGHTFTNENIL